MSTQNTNPGIDVSKPIKMPLTQFVSLMVVLVGAAVGGMAYLNKIERKVDDLARAVAEQQKRSWLYEEQISWVTALDREFRRSEYNIPPANKYRSTP